MQTQQRTNAADDTAWLVWALGMMLIGTGVAWPYANRATAFVVGLIAPVMGFMLLVALFWGLVILEAIVRRFF